MEKIRTQATKIAVEKVKIAIEKVQFTKVKKAATTWDTPKRTLTKTIHKKGQLNKIPDIYMATQGDEGKYDQNRNLFLGFSLFLLRKCYMLFPLLFKNL